MATTSQLHDVKVALVDALRLRAGLAGVPVYSALVSSEDRHNTTTNAIESIEFAGDADSEQGWGAIGKFTRDETLRILGMVYVQKDGAGEDVIRSARARALALWAEVETYLRGDPSIGNTVKYVHKWQFRCDEWAQDQQRRCALFFVIETFNQLRS